MDAYIDHSFATYNGEPDLIDWCFQKNILFMINTTGFLGYFQRVFAKGLLPVVPAISANPMIKYPASETDPPYIYDLQEIENKSKNTSSALQLSDEPISSIILIGDSGGEGPHFHWGAKQGAFLNREHGQIFFNLLLPKEEDRNSTSFRTPVRQRRDKEP